MGTVRIGFGRRGVGKVRHWAVALAAVMALRVAAAPAGYEAVGFDRLAGYRFVAPEPASPDAEAAAVAASEQQIPVEVRQLAGRKVAVTGYMLPVRLVEGRVEEFLLVKDPSMCCYGVVPQMNEWVVVKMKSGGVPPVMDVPVSFFGELTVGPKFENGYLTGIYELAGEGMAESRP